MGKKPLKSKQTRAQNALARKSLSTGDLATSMGERKKERDAKTLYVKFKGGQLPTELGQIKEISPDIKEV